MKTIMVATDLSERSDRAIRRAILLARQFGSAITLVHVVDDDRPAALVKGEHAKAGELVEQQSRSIAEIDGVTCSSRIILGDAFAGIRQAARELDPDLIVVGPHRRIPVKDAFIGTTAERTIRESSKPVLIANGIPASHYKTILIAADLSACSKTALAAIQELGLDRAGSTALVYAAETSAIGLRSSAWHSRKDVEATVMLELDAARKELDAFLAGAPWAPDKVHVERCGDHHPAEVILAKAAAIGADLVVLGTHGRSGASRWLLGSVAEDTLRKARQDVLVVPEAAATR